MPGSSSSHARVSREIMSAPAEIAVDNCSMPSSVAMIVSPTTWASSSGRRSPSSAARTA